VNNALSLAEAVVSAEPLAEVDVVCLVGASAEVVEILATLRENVEKYQAAFSAFNAARTAWEVHLAASGASMPFDARHAVHAANAAAQWAELLDEPQATYAIEAAHRDYMALLKRFGEQKSVVVGEPFELHGGEVLPDLFSTSEINSLNLSKTAEKDDKERGQS
jgi:hypothetical protein